ncbi:MAG: YceI family protein [Rhodanobacteraceae bacterium]
MIRLLQLSAAWLLLAYTGQCAAAELYRIDPVHTQILFSVSHNGFSHPVGRLHVKSGWLRANADDITLGAAEVDIDLADVDMGDKDWNEAVRGSRLLDAAEHPIARYISTSIEPQGKDKGVMHGKLSLHGRTVPVDVNYNLNRQGATIFGLDTRIGFSASAELDRRQFGITAFSGSIGHAVTIRLEVEAVADPRAVEKYLKVKTKDDSHE